MKKIVLLCIFTVTFLVSCKENSKSVDRNSTAATREIKKKPKSISNTLSTLNLDSLAHINSVLDSVYDNNDGIVGVVDWTKKNLKTGVKLQFKKREIKPDRELIISKVMIERLDKHGEETGEFYLKPKQPVDYNKSTLFYSYRENFKPKPYNLLIYVYK